ncbi:MAG TPA: hypothetical protein VGN90_04125 [Pyrinomonadaceae bacterium]|nr:hypothetical protein [Pyrinomonadaceae bacterium]
MRNVSRNFMIAAAVSLAVLFLIGGTSAQGPGMTATKEKPVYIQAQAFGEGTQMGQNYGVNILIEEYSTADDQKALMGAFDAKSNEGLVNALSKMKSKGRISLTGTLGYDMAYIRAFPQPDGTTKLRMVTNRPISFGEAWSDSRSMDYSLSGVEVILSADKKKNSGTLLPACQFKIDKEGQLQIELLRNAFRLADVRIR